MNDETRREPSLAASSGAIEEEHIVPAFEKDSAQKASSSCGLCLLTILLFVLLFGALAALGWWVFREAAPLLRKAGLETSSNADQQAERARQQALDMRRRAEEAVRRGTAEPVRAAPAPAGPTEKRSRREKPVAEAEARAILAVARELAVLADDKDLQRRLKAIRPADIRTTPAMQQARRDIMRQYTDALNKARAAEDAALQKKIQRTLREYHRGVMERRNRRAAESEPREAATPAKADAASQAAASPATMAEEEPAD